jgi:lysophospholipase L1-like esterase
MHAGGSNSGAGGGLADSGSGAGGSGGVSSSGSGGARADGGTGGSSAAAGSGGRGGSGGTDGGRGGSGGSDGGARTVDASREGGRTGTLRVMPLGDSTTASICYRSYLWQMLTGAGHTQFDFVGTRSGNPGCTFSAYDQDNEGHGGYVVSDVLKAAGTGVRSSGADTTDPFVADSRDLATWFDGHPADIVLMHFGTNDVWNSAPISSQRLQMILMAYDAILAKLRANNPNVMLLVAQITPLAPTGCTPCTANARALDDLIPGWATANTRPESPISVVDQFTGFVPATDTVDGVHSNNSGSMKIANNWFNALAPLF